MKKNKRLLKIIILFTILILIAVIIWMAASPQTNKNKGENSEMNTQNADWMSRLDDSLALNELSIPATHDSGATISLLGISGQCQKTTIKEQLDMGVRFLDIRLRLVNDELNVVHGIVDQNLTFESVLKDISKFIEDYPSEFIIMSIKQDDDPKDSTLNFHEKVEADLAKYPLISTNREFPESVGEARGKIFILARYGEATVGIPASPGWRDSTSFELNGFYVQDNYRITDVEVKKNDIKKAIKIAQNKEYPLVLNFASCYLENALPPASASKTAKQINPFLLDIIDEENGPLGVILCDYITTELCSAIIEKNF